MRYFFILSILFIAGCQDNNPKPDEGALLQHRLDSMDRITELQVKQIRWETDMKIALAGRGLSEEEKQKYIDSVSLLKFNEAGGVPEWYIEMKKKTRDSIK